MADPIPSVTPMAVAQPAGVPWPTEEWPEAPGSAALLAAVDAGFDDPVLGVTRAVLVILHGAIVAERYEGELPNFSGPPITVHAETPLLGWSIGKSIVHAAVGLLVSDGRLNPDAPAPVPEWSGAGDPRAAITLRQLLQMRDGLKWNEDYEDDSVSDVIEMLYGAGSDDVAGFAARHELAHEPGTVYNYSSGTTNIISRIVGDVVGRGEATTAFYDERLLHPIGIRDARLQLDAAGTFVGSSFPYCSARSYARFATLYLRGGEWDGRRILPRAWTDEAQVPASADPDGMYYSNHWWCDGLGTYWASGHFGQRILVSPARDAILARFGETPEAHYPDLRAWALSVLDALD
jgi:CubicO group peptidase (beta-lactamase class C family)